MARKIAEFIVCRAEPLEWPDRRHVFVPLADFDTREAAESFRDEMDALAGEGSFPHEVIRLDGGPNRRFLVRWNDESIDEWARPGPLTTDDERYPGLGVSPGDFVYLIGRTPDGSVSLLSRMEVTAVPGPGGEDAKLRIPEVRKDRVIPADDLFMNILFWRRTAPNSIWDPVSKTADEGRYAQQRAFVNLRSPRKPGSGWPKHFRYLRPALVEDQGGGTYVLGQTVRNLSEIARGGEWLDHAMGLGPGPTDDWGLTHPSVSTARGRSRRRR